LYTITVNPTPAVNTVSNAVYCNGSAGAAISFGSPTSGGTVTYNWTSNNNVGFGTSGTGDILAYNATNTGSLALVADVNVIATVNGCTGPATTFTVTVNPSPDATISVTTPIQCNGTTGTVTITPNVGTAPFTFYFEGETTNTTGIFTDVSAGTYTWSITDANGCSSAISSLIVNEPAAIPVSGTVKYYNTPKTAMNNVTVILQQVGSDVYTSIPTDASGNYSFMNVCPGTYDVIFITGKSVGGINASDAALVNAWGVGPQYSIQKVKYFAGDVIKDNYLQASDAGTILNYFVTAGATPMTPKWTFWKTNDATITQSPTPTVLTLTVPSNSLPITQDYYALVTGDFNGSFTPGTTNKSMNENLTLNIGGTKLVETGTEFELPITAGMDMEVGAISLILDFPVDKLEVTGVYLGTDPASPMEYAIVNNELRIGWNTASPVSLSTGNALLTLKLRTLVPIPAGETIRLNLTSDPLNELADGNYNMIANALLFVDEVGGLITDVKETGVTSQMKFESYPNPFVGNTTFVYTIPEDGKVVIEISSMLGSTTHSLVDEWQTSGYHTFTVDLSDNRVGVYSATLRLITKDGLISRTIKIIRQQ
jgi:hypothetical protein